MLEEVDKVKQVGGSEVIVGVPSDRTVGHLAAPLPHLAAS